MNFHMESKKSLTFNFDTIRRQPEILKSSPQFEAENSTAEDKSSQAFFS